VAHKRRRGIGGGKSGCEVEVARPRPLVDCAARRLLRMQLLVLALLLECVLLYICISVYNMQLLVLALLLECVLLNTYAYQSLICTVLPGKTTPHAAPARII
jgi:hypothetical protein